MAWQARKTTEGSPGPLGVESGHCAEAADGYDASMSGYQCWFCGKPVERADGCAVLITIEGLWKWDAGSATDEDPSQSFYAHSHCAKDRLQGATMVLEPHIFGEDD